MASTLVITKKNLSGIVKEVDARLTFSAYVAVRSAADGVTTDGSATVTSATLAFVAGDVGRDLAGTGIPAGAYIITVNSATSVTLSAAATATATGVTFTLGGGEMLTPAMFGMRRIISLYPQVENSQLGLTFFAEWNGSGTHPSISMYTDGGSSTGLPEVAAGAMTDIVHLIVRGV